MTEIPVPDHIMENLPNVKAYNGRLTIIAE